MSSETIKSLLEAQLLGHTQKLFEMSLTRIMSHVAKAKEQGFAILTSWRQSNDASTNTANFSALKAHVRSLGLGFIQLEGHWQECQDVNVPYDKCPPSDIKDSIEPSLMVFKIHLKDAVELGKSFDQDAVVYAGPETGGQTQLHFKNGETMDLGEFNPSAIGQAYSVWRNKRPKKPDEKSAKFTFEGYGYPAQSFVDKLTEMTLLKNISVLKEGIKTC
jgi:hypothetical protein